MRKRCGLPRRRLRAGLFRLLGGAFRDPEGGLAVLALDQLAADLFRDGEDLAAGETGTDDLYGHRRSGGLIGSKAGGLEDCGLRTLGRRCWSTPLQPKIRNPKSKMESRHPLSSAAQMLSWYGFASGEIAGHARRSASKPVRGTPWAEPSP